MDFPKDEKDQALPASTAQQDPLGREKGLSWADRFRVLGLEGLSPQEARAVLEQKILEIINTLLVRDYGSSLTGNEIQQLRTSFDNHGYYGNDLHQLIYALWFFHDGRWRNFEYSDANPARDYFRFQEARDKELFIQKLMSDLNIPSNEAHICLLRAACDGMDGRRLLSEYDCPTECVPLEVQMVLRELDDLARMFDQAAKPGGPYR